jgi:hypothetical protein
MSLLDRLREAQDEPARHRASPYVGPSILTVEQLRAMERALAHEGFFHGNTTVADVAEEPRVIDVAALPPAPVVEPLPIWTPPEAVPAAQALPVWSPLAFEPSVDGAPLGPCPKCGEEIEIERIDLTANAGWLTCRACGLRWGGTIDPSPPDRVRVLPVLPPADDKTGERGHVAAG